MNLPLPFIAIPVITSTINYLVVEPNQLKNITVVKLDHFPRDRGEKKVFEPPTRFLNVAAVFHLHWNPVKLPKFPKHPQSIQTILHPNGAWYLEGALVRGPTCGSFVVPSKVASTSPEKRKGLGPEMARPPTFRVPPNQFRPKIGWLIPTQAQKWSANHILERFFWLVHKDCSLF